MSDPEFSFSSDKAKELQHFALEARITKAEDRIRELKAEMAEIEELKTRHPGLAARPNDKGLGRDEYRMWQLIHRESGTISNLKKQRAELRELRDKLRNKS
jgi:hypothetical protein